MMRKEARGRSARAQCYLYARKSGLGGVTLWALCSFVAAHVQAAPPGLGKQVAKATAKKSSGQAAGQAPQNANGQPPTALKVVAVVNGEPINRDDLAKQCLWHYGKDLLEVLINRRIIENQCKVQNIVVTASEVDAEIERMAERFGLPTQQWLKLLEDERHIKPVQYGQDIVWPMLALQKLAAGRLQVTDQDLREAWETQYGPAVKARLIACDNRSEAEKVRALALKNPNDFGNLAKQYSVDKSSASLKGLILPIRKHLGNKAIELAAFSLRVGEISPIIQVGNQFVFIKCEDHIPQRDVPMAQVEKLLREAIRDKKLRLSADDILRELQAKSVVEVIYADPQKRAQMPGIAAKVDGQIITVAELAEECVKRNGVEVLDGTINRRLLEQACRRQRLEVTPQDIDEEIARAAIAMGKTNSQGGADVAAWFKAVAEQGISKEMYTHDTVWPTVALKKLVGTRIEVTAEDIQHGFEANYGPRVRCRAIVMSSLRRAQEVWEQARDKPTADHFGELAAQYSIEPSSRALNGEIPPIQRWGGEPVLEKEAFSLQPGELSGVVQVGENFVILFCEGQTEPVKVSLDEVRDLIAADVYEKKLRIAMAREFDHLRASAQIDNYLGGKSQSPEVEKPKTSVSLDPLVRPATANQPRRAGSAVEHASPRKR